MRHQTGLGGPPAPPPVMEEHRPGLTGTVPPAGNRQFRSIKKGNTVETQTLFLHFLSLWFCIVFNSEACAEFKNQKILSLGSRLANALTKL